MVVIARKKARKENANQVRVSAIQSVEGAPSPELTVISANHLHFGKYTYSLTCWELDVSFIHTRQIIIDVISGHFISYRAGLDCTQHMRVCIVNMKLVN